MEAVGKYNGMGLRGKWRGEWTKWRQDAAGCGSCVEGDEDVGWDRT